MSLTNSPQIATNGLVYYHDVNNIKSYQGPAVQNLLNQAGPTFTGTGTATGYSSVGGTETVNIPQLGKTSVAYNLIQNNYTSYSPNSGNCCPSLFTHGASVPVSGNTLYTYSIVYKCDSGYTNANYMYRYEYNGGTYVTEGGVFNTANQIHLGSGWYWAWGTFTTQATTTNLLYMGAWYYRYAPTVDKLAVANVLLVAGNYTGMHPRYWPAMNTTRTTTQALVDLTGNTTITANSLTYASDGSFSFNGTSDYISLSTANLPYGSAPGTISAWAKTSTITGSYSWIFSYGVANNSQSRFIGIVGSSFLVGGYGNDISVAGVPLNTWFHMVCAYDGTTAYLYVNGVLLTSAAKTWTTVLGNAQIGRQTNNAEYWNGNISNVMVHNRALSATEIAQNFQAFRGRYGV